LNDKLGQHDNSNIFNRFYEEGAGGKSGRRHTEACGVVPRVSKAIHTEARVMHTEVRVMHKTRVRCARNKSPMHMEACGVVPTVSKAP